MQISLHWNFFGWKFTHHVPVFFTIWRRHTSLRGKNPFKQFAFTVWRRRRAVREKHQWWAALLLYLKHACVENITARRRCCLLPCDTCGLSCKKDIWKDETIRKATSTGWNYFAFTYFPQVGYSVSIDLASRKNQQLESSAVPSGKRNFFLKICFL